MRREGVTMTPISGIRARNMDNLMSLGGFIGELTEEYFYENTNSVSIRIAEKIYGCGPGICMVAAAVPSALETVEKKYNSYIHEYYVPTELDMSSNSLECFYDAFSEWFINASVKLEGENLKTGREYFWSSWQLGRSYRKALKSLAPLEERILYLSIVDERGGKRCEEDEIAEIIGCGCKPDYINIVISRIGEFLDCCGVSIAGLEQAARDRQ